MKNKINPTTWKLASFILIALLGFSEVGAAQEGIWTERTPMPTGRCCFSTSVVNGRIYAIGGVDREGKASAVEMYDPITDTWIERTPLPTPRSHLSTNEVDGIIYAVGGIPPAGGFLAVVEAYNPATDTWIQKTDMPTPRAAPSSSIVNGKIYTIGGWNTQGARSSVEAYDPTTDTWTKKADMPTARDWFSTSAVDGKIYAIGGEGGPRAFEVYDPITDSWTKKARLPGAKTRLSTSVVDGKIYVIGGIESSQVLIYDPVINTWQPRAIPSMSRARFATSVVNGVIYAIGGGSTNQHLSRVQAYDTGVGVRVATIFLDVGRIGGGDPITISGKGFPLDVTVTIGGRPLSEPEVTEDQITGIIPPGEAGEQDILITAPSIDFTVFAGQFSYIVPGNFTVVRMTPSSGARKGGETGRVTGSGFQQGAAVTVGNISATDITVNDETHITFTIPSGATGTKDVVVTNPDGQERVLSGSYTHNPFPIIERIEPDDGPIEGNTSIIITGDNFVPDTIVTIGELPAGRLKFLSPTELRLETPPATPGPKPVRVFNPDGQEDAREAGFTYIVTLVPDANLRAALESALGRNPRDAITADDLATLTVLDARNSNVSDLIGLEHTTRLIDLSLGANDINDVSPLVSLTNLTRLALGANDINDVSPLVSLTNLTRLALEGNDINDVSPLTALTNLTELGLTTNQISDVSPLAALTNLTDLQLVNNQISDVSPLAALTNLTELGLTVNQISDVSPLAALTNLTELGLTTNQISDMSPLAALANLTELRLDNNEISDVSPLAALTSLTSLTLTTNQIRNISPLTTLTDLTRLQLSANPLSYESLNTHIPVLQDRGVRVIFSGRVPTTLTNLSGDGQIGGANTSLPSPLMVEVKDRANTAFEGVPVTFAVTAGEGSLSIEEVTTDVNGLAQTTLTLGVSVGPYTVEARAADLTTPSTFTAHVPVPIPDARLRTVLEAQMGKNSGDPITTTELETLSVLPASDRDISDLSGLEYARNLIRLVLNDNAITDVGQLAVLTKLADLQLGNNQIDDVSSLAALTDLTDLRLGNNQISDVSPLADLTNLIRLELFSNEISDLTPLTTLANLTDLRLSTNEINDVSPLANLTKLTRLELFSNQINNLSRLADLSNLTDLQLANNRVSNLSPLSALTNLTELRLSGNEINDLNALESLTNLETLELSANIISDLSPLAGLTNLTTLELSANQIRDIKPLVQNTRIDSGDTVRLLRNPLTYSAIGEDIPALEDRDVTVLVISPRSVPNTLLKISGDNQTGELNSTLANPFVVRVEDQRGNPFEGVPVTFSVTTGGGVLSVENVNTDANGLAETTLTLGESAGTNTVEVTAAEIDAPQTFTAGNIAVEIVIDRIEPPGGPLEGGTEVTITGGVFNEDTQITIGGFSLLNLEFGGLTRLIGTTPRGTEGPQDVVVIRGEQRDVLEGGFRYARAPIIEGIDPTGGVFGTEVTIQGSNFLEGLADQSIDVRVGDVPGVEIQFESPERLTFTAPFLPSGREYPVTVLNPDGQQSQERIVFTYNSPPRIAEVSPSRGKVVGGTTVILRGENFICQDIALELDGTAVELNDGDCSPTELRFTTPQGSSAGAVDIVVTNSDEQFSSQTFTYTSPPIVHSVTPEIGNPDGDTLITIHGENFLEAVDGRSIAVRIGGRDAESVRRFSDTEISALTPATETLGRTVRLIVIGPEGQESLEGVTFTYNHRLDISGISPRMGAAAGGTEVTVSGGGFTDVGQDPFKVSLGDQEADVVQLVSSTEVIIQTPAGSPGAAVTLTIENGDGQTDRLDGFSYTETLAAMNLSPRVGSLDGGTQVVITGSGFMDEEIDGRKLAVAFGGRPAVIISITSVQLTLRTPPGGADAVVEVIVTGPDGQEAPLPSPFHYLDFPADDVLVYNYPNPTTVGRGTTFRFRTADGSAEIKIFNTGGELIIGLSGTGGDTILWDGRNRFGDVVPDGLYPYVYVVDDEVKQGQLLHIHR